MKLGGKKTCGAIVFGLWAFLGSLVATSAGECVVRGERVTLEEAVIRPVQAAPFRVSLHEVPASVRVGARRGQRVTLAVKSAIAFEATAKNLWYTTSTMVETVDGLVRLFPGAHLIGVRADGDAVLGAAVLSAGNVQPGEDAKPREVIEPVRVPCGALTLDWLAHDVDDLGIRGDGTWWQTRRSQASVRLRAEPRPSAQARTLTIFHQEGDVRFAFDRLDSKGDWVKVARVGDNMFASGWIRRADIEPIPDAPVRGDSGCCGGHGAGLAGRRYAGTPRKGLYAGPARIVIGTKVYAGQGRAPWATVAQNEPFGVRYADGDSWAEITHIPGVSGSELSAYVPVSTIIRDR